MSAENSEITKDQLTAMFKNMAEKSKWDLTKPMLWGYFFTNETRDALDKNKDRLVKDGYRFVDIYNNGEKWWLHVEKEEVHTVNSLFLRNKDLYKFASDHSISTYDGMDVGPIAK
jgi:Regulator of ribonuclease activity B